ncbi:MAG: phenylalanine--tRNA ligase subunit beta [Sulfobacillus acidophilus]|uniref:Phenylalanine--tRNA ligase beta subunit n=1 Tax=Sulfobacillus acidophilus TaxID=53633 RepID=A0A2T2WIX9_9FIRM|nr:MAG: phenylalanine--tRNA ligase subunit beta [Sulfobacillus acidophilus]
MILSHRWLSRHLNPLPEPSQVVRALEQLGIEVVARRTYGENFAQVELVEVVTRTPHPDSDHLSLVTVRRGSGELTQIVTGADNGFPQDRLWYAPPGTTLADGRTMEIKMLRGIASPGMLLSAEELGYQAPGGDLWVWTADDPLGTRFLDVVGGVDTLYDLELTPNIAQYLQSVRRIAAELAAVLNLDVSPATPEFTYGADLRVEVQSLERCSLYGLVRMSLVEGQVSPLWLQTLLRAVGQRVIHPAVDITNFVLWDLGEPLHAFDARRVDGHIIVRLARPHEQLRLLDGTTLTLTPDDLVIADERKVLALAGIMGGVDAGIAADTTEILLECAHFAPQGIFKSSRAHRLSTDAALHFGRGTDPEAVLQAPRLVQDILHAAGVLQQIRGSSRVGQLEAQRSVPLDFARIRSLLGVDWPDDDISMALQGFGYQLEEGAAVVPRYRHDVSAVNDLAEDVARYYGLARIPRTLPVQRSELAHRDAAAMWDEEVRDLATACGYHEVITRTFSHAQLDSQFAVGPRGSAVVVTNPLRAEESLLRRFLLPSLLEVVRYNRSYHDLPIRIFEVGSVFHRVDERVIEQRELGVVLSLDPTPEFPPRPAASIYDLTGLADYLFERLGWSAQRDAFVDPPAFLHPGRAQRITSSCGDIGYVGELRPRLASLYRVRRLGVLVLRLPDAIERTRSKPARPSRFPEVQRDLSLVVPEKVTYAELAECLDALKIDILRGMRPIDRFEGAFGTSLTVRITFQSDVTTLTDAAVDEIISQMLLALSDRGVELRQ